MKFDLNNKVNIIQAKTKLDYFISKGYLIELKRILPVRTKKQNAYLHLILSWFAIEYGETLEYVKVEFYKKQCNPELFVFNRENVKTGEIRTDLRSTTTLNTKELSTSIERFRNWASTIGIYLPEPNEDEFLKQIEVEVEKYKQYI